MPHSGFALCILVFSIAEIKVFPEYHGFSNTAFVKKKKKNPQEAFIHIRLFSVKHPTERITAYLR